MITYLIATVIAIPLARCIATQLEDILKRHT